MKSTRVADEVAPESQGWISILRSDEAVIRSFCLSMFSAMTCQPLEVVVEGRDAGTSQIETVEVALRTGQHTLILTNDPLSPTTSSQNLKPSSPLGTASP